MKTKNTIEENRKKIIEFVKNNPSATYKKVREEVKSHPERYFKGGMKEIFEKANIKPPRTFERKSKEQRQKIIINYIKKNPRAGGQIISRETKINIDKTFKNIQDAYAEARIEYPRKESYKLSPEEKRKIVIKLVKENPHITLVELSKELGIKNIYRLFKNLDEIYKKANIQKVGQGEKIKKRKREDVINFIKKNPLATQREINNACKTKVQELFDKGIFDAYRKANMVYPFERLKLYGTALKEIKKRARDFESQIAVMLAGYGKVNRLVKTKRGVADIILERKNKKIIIEVKDYLNKEISISQIKQLNNYLEDCDSNLGILICHKKPKKDKFLIGRNKIFILEKQELKRIPEI